MFDNTGNSPRGGYPFTGIQPPPHAVSYRYGHPHIQRPVSFCERHYFALVISIAVIALIVRGLMLYQLHNDGYAAVISHFPESETTDTLSWASAISNGDRLSQSAGRFLPWWMTRVADLEDWNEWFGAERVFPYAPLYPYVVSGIIALDVSNPIFMVLVFQSLLGVCTCILVAWIGTKIYTCDAGILSAFLCSVYGPLLFHETLISPSILIVFLQAMLLIMALKTLGTRELNGFMLFGLLGAINILAAPSSVFIFAALCLYLGRYNPIHGYFTRRGLVSAWAVMMVMLAPAVGRNSIVQAPAWLFSAAGVYDVILTNSNLGDPLRHNTSSEIRALMEHEGSLWQHGALSIFSYYRNSPILLVNNTLDRLSAALAPIEISEDIHTHYVKSIVFILSFLPGFGVIFPLSVLGVYVSWKIFRFRCPIFWYVGGLLPGLLMGSYRSGDRLSLVFCMILMAAAGLLHLSWSLNTKGKRLYLAACFCVVALGAFAQFMAANKIPPHVVITQTMSPTEYLVAADTLSRVGRIDDALAKLDKALAVSSAHPRHEQMARAIRNRRNAIRNPSSDDSVVER